MLRVIGVGWLVSEDRLDDFCEWPRNVCKAGHKFPVITN